MVSMRKYASSAFIKLDDVQDRPRRETIVDVVEGKWDKPILKFASGAQFSLNKGNVATMIAEFGEDGDSWIGVTIELFAGKAEYDGDLKDSVLVKPIAAKSPAATPKTTERRTDDSGEIPF